MAQMNRRGFSLIEMMVVIAIISILSLVAVPSYKTFQAKARQKQGFNLLNMYFTSATATRAEFSRFPGNFVQTGFQPVGQLNYQLISVDGNDINMGSDAALVRINDDACTITSAACDCTNNGTNCPTFKTWDEMGVGGVGNIGVANTGILACNGILGPPATTNNTFIVVAGGWISTSAGNFDRYAIDHTKNLQMCQDGLK